MLEELFKQIMNEIDYKVETGLNIEIKDFFRGTENVSEYKLEILEGKKYRILVKLREYNLQEVKRIFSAFLHFVEYSNMSFYVRREKDEGIEYLVLSARADRVGFYCQLLFLK